MSIVGQVESVWRYPVKSMRGETAPEIFASFAGVYGDRLFAFKSSAAPAGFPYFTGRERHELLLYQPRFRHPQRAALPQNLAEAEALAPGLNLNPVGADPADLGLDVETPSGKVLAIDDPALLRELAEGTASDHSLTLLRSERSMTDCRPISLIALQTVRQLGEEVGIALDQRRFRANVYLDLQEPAGFFRGEGLNFFPDHSRRLDHGGGVAEHKLIFQCRVERGSKDRMNVLNAASAEATLELLVQEAADVLRGELRERNFPQSGPKVKAHQFFVADPSGRADCRFCDVLQPPPKIVTHTLLVHDHG